VSKYPLPKYLIQACPPDMSESRADARWGFGVYEILDQRVSPMEPRVMHTVYRGVVELTPEEMPSTDDPSFSAKLDEAVVAKWKSLVY
jgi:hypothetical protein